MSESDFLLLKTSPRRWVIIGIDMRLAPFKREGGITLENVAQYKPLTKPLARECALDCLALLRINGRLPERYKA